MTDSPMERNRYQEVDDRLRAEHAASLTSSAMMWTWACSCGKAGNPTSQGRAAAALDRHLTAESRRIHAQVFAPAAPADDTCWCDGPDCGQTPCVEAR